jgi:hypothetical protein
MIHNREMSQEDRLSGWMQSGSHAEEAFADQDTTGKSGHLWKIRTPLDSTEKYLHI